MLLGYADIAIKDRTTRHKVLDQVDFSDLIREWATEHSSASPSQARDSLESVFREALRKFYTKYHYYSDLPTVIVNLTCAGYDNRSAVEFTTEIKEGLDNPNPDMEPISRDGHMNLPPGLFVPLGTDKVCKAILSGDQRIPKEYRDTKVAKKYRHLKDSQELAQLTTSDMIELSRTCLSATESKFATTFDPDAFGVGAPNAYAIISQDNGFRLLPSK
jgi:hypothetical protein